MDDHGRAGLDAQVGQVAGQGRPWVDPALGLLGARCEASWRRSPSAWCQPSEPDAWRRGFAIGGPITAHWCCEIQPASGPQRRGSRSGDGARRGDRSHPRPRRADRAGDRAHDRRRAGRALGLTPAAVRRHLDALLAAGLVEEREPRGHRDPWARPPGPAVRRSPTPAGTRSTRTTTTSPPRALRFLAETGGREAVGAFARQRVAELEARYRPVVEAARPDERAEALAARPRRGRLRCRGAPDRQRPGRRWPAGRSAALPAPLPGRARRRGVPAALRGRDRGLRRACSAPTSSASRPSPTATASAPRYVPTGAPTQPAPPPPHHARPTPEESSMTAIPETTHAEVDGLGRYEFGWSDSDAAGATARRGLSEDVVRNISALKSEPEWMLDLRLKGLRLFGKKPMPTWGSDLSGIDFDNIKYFVRSTEKQADHLGRPARRHQEHLRPARHPRGREAAPRRRRRRAVRVRGRLPPDPRGPRGAGRHLPRHRHRRCASTRSCSASTSARSSRSATTSSPRSTPRSGRAARSSTCPRASTSTSRCRPTSGSTPRTWASSSGR